jgi:hypothetical protein
MVLQVREEGGTDGGVVVQDCLALMANLLRDNASNQVRPPHAEQLCDLPICLGCRSGSAGTCGLQAQAFVEMVCGGDEGADPVRQQDG